MALARRLEKRHGKDWVRVLLENYAINWTEYTLYYLTAESTGLLEQRHRMPAEDEPRLLAPYRVWSRSEFDMNRVVEMFATPQQDFFSVIQSNTGGVTAKEIASLIAPYVPITLNTNAAGSCRAEGEASGNNRAPRSGN